MRRRLTRTLLLVALLLPAAADAGLCDGLSDGTPCDDGLFCNGADTCFGNVCLPAGDPCAAGGECADACDEAADACHDPAATPCTDDSNPCTDDACDGAGACAHPANTAPCDDGLFCTGADSCAAGACSLHAGDPCAAGGECADACDEAADACHDPAATPCTDDSNPCTDDACDGAGACAHPANTAPCDDGLFCTVNDTCAGATCQAVTRDCGAAGDACNTGACDEGTQGCVPQPRPDDTPCNDGDGCTQTDGCQGGSCAGENPVLCQPLDACHLAGMCNPATGMCSNPSRPDGSPCSDGQPCTGADQCQSGVCGGAPIAGCCLADPDCDDSFACTEDRCLDNACVRVPHDDRCGLAQECAAPACAPGEPGAGPNGCVLRPTGENTYCTEDLDPCTADICLAGRCTHAEDGSGARCPVLALPFRTALAQHTRALELQAAVALGAACSAGDAACGVTPTAPSAARMVALAERASTDLDAVVLTLAGRLVTPGIPDPTREPAVRARLALGLVGETPATLRAFLATVTLARTQRAVTRGFARERRAEGRRLLLGTRKLRAQLRRLLAQRQTFVR